MNVLVLGSGGREHTLAWKIAQSKKLNKLYIAPGNAGTAHVGENIAISETDFDKIKSFVLEKGINLVVVGPEAPLVQGIHDFFLNDEQIKNIPVVGPAKAGAELEGSKDFAKKFMARHNVPTAAYQTFTKDTLNKAYDFLETLNAPYVLKADGLAAGKGVLILDDINEAKNELAQMFEGKFGDAGAKVVIEEFLSGIELSVFVLTDGESYKLLPSAKDYKRIGEGDTGLNTGGMGAVSPVPFADDLFLSKVEERIVKPTVAGLKADNIPYKGFIFIGLMNVNGNPLVIEYNVRMGDPETEVVIPRIQSDFLDLLEGVGNKTLGEKEFELNPDYFTTVMMVSGGYPEAYKKGKEIINLDKVEDSIAFHAGTKIHDGNVVTNGGRVIAVTSSGKTIQEALDKSYKNANLLDFDKKYFRKDIGQDLL